MDNIPPILLAIKFGLDILQPIVTIAAVLAGLWWFIIRRATAKKVNIEHIVQFVTLKTDVYVGVTVRINNIGNIKVSNAPQMEEKSGIVIEELSPYLERHRELQENAQEYELDFLGGRFFPELLLEPGEQQNILFEFIIPKTSRAIKVYSFIDNPSSDGLGWNKTTVHEVT